MLPKPDVLAAERQAFLHATASLSCETKHLKCAGLTQWQVQVGAEPDMTTTSGERRYRFAGLGSTMM
jgi:hypothetical protein